MAPPIDFARHNEEVARVWQAYHEGAPTRVPMILGVATRYTLLSPDANPEGYSFQDYFTDPDIMFRHQLRHQWWVRHHLVSDAEMGPAKEWGVNVDLQNSYEALWFGCPLEFREGQCPDTVPILHGDNKRRLFDAGLPEPFPAHGWIARAWEYLQQFEERARSEEFEGAPIRAGSVPGLGTDGPLTAACNLRGATEVLLDMRTDTDYYLALMEYIVTATLERIRAYRERLGHPEESEAWGFADDSVQLLSVRDYEAYVLPFHKRLIEAFGSKGPNSIHLCGDVQRLLPVVQRELNVQSFDTGFPVDLGALRQALGPGAQIHGGPHVELLRSGSPQTIREEVRRILQSGVTEGGRFVLRDANNLAPGTPPESVAVMYEACKEYGRYEG